MSSSHKSVITPEMEPLSLLIPLAADVDHVAAYKALISRRSQRGRQLHDYFDQIIAQFRARDDFLMAQVNSLQKTLDDHGIPLPTPGRRATTPLENVSVGQQENYITTVEDDEPSSDTTDSGNPGQRARINRKRSSSGSMPSPKRPKLSRLSPRAEDSGSSPSSLSDSAMPPRANRRMRKWGSARGSKQRRRVARVHPNDSSSPEHVSELSELPSSEARTSPLEPAPTAASNEYLGIKREVSDEEHENRSESSESEPVENDSIIPFEVFGDPLLALSPTPTISGWDETSSYGVSDLGKQEDIDPQHAVGDDHSDDLGESRSGASLVSFDYGEIHSALLQTFYDPGSERGRRSRYDADYESSDVDEGNGSVANDTEANDTVDNDIDVATEVIIKTEPEESLLGSFPPSEQVRVKLEPEESVGGSLSPSEISRIAPRHRTQHNGSVRGWAQRVARATAATEPDAGPVLGRRSEPSLAGTAHASQDTSPTIKKENETE